jgi:hypothetical protein
MDEVERDIEIDRRELQAEHLPPFEIQASD